MAYQGSWYEINYHYISAGTGGIMNGGQGVRCFLMIIIINVHTLMDIYVHLSIGLFRVGVVRDRGVFGCSQMDSKWSMILWTVSLDRQTLGDLGGKWDILLSFS